MGTFDYFRLLLINAALSSRARGRAFNRDRRCGATARLFINPERCAEASSSRKTLFPDSRGTAVVAVTFGSQDRLRACTSFVATVVMPSFRGPPGPAQGEK
jgi:hypothetical protein